MNNYDWSDVGVAYEPLTENGLLACRKAITRLKLGSGGHIKNDDVSLFYWNGASWTNKGRIGRSLMDKRLVGHYGK